MHFLQHQRLGDLLVLAQRKPHNRVLSLIKIELKNIYRWKIHLTCSWKTRFKMIQSVRWVNSNWFLFLVEWAEKLKSWMKRQAKRISWVSCKIFSVCEFCVLFLLCVSSFWLLGEFGARFFFVDYPRTWDFKIL